MLKIKHLTLLFLFVSMVGFGQTKIFTDSVSLKIKQDASDSLRTSTYYSAAKHSLYKQGNLKLFRSYIDSSMQYAKHSKHLDLEAKSHFLYGLLERLEGNYDKALEHLEININYFKNDSINKSYAMFQKGTIYRQLGDFEKSLKTNLDILRIFESKKDSFAIASTLNGIAILYEQMNNHDEALVNFKDARKIFLKKNVKRDVCNTDLNIALIYERKEEEDKAIKFAQNALDISKEIGIKELEGRSLHVLGTIYIKSNLQKGLKYFLEAKKILDETNFESRKLAVNVALGNAYYDNKNYTKAKNLLISALEVAKEKQIIDQVKEVSIILSEIAVKESDYKKAYNYSLVYSNAKDSIINTENSKNINLLHKQFETEKKDKEIAEQNLKLVENEKEIQKKKTQYSYMTGAALLLLIGLTSTWFVYQQRQKHKNQEILTLKREQQVQTLESLMEGEEKERLRISKELHDGVNVDLSAIKYKLTSMLEKNNQVINEVVTMIDKSCEQVRAISHNLVPPSLKDFSLIETIEDFCTTTNSIHSPAISFTHIGEAVTISKKAEVNIFRIVQELVNNSLKHAEATEINVQLSNHNNNLQLTVEDNGKGFKKEETKSNGIGMQNIQSRVDYLAAKLDFSSNEKGTSYIIDLNIEALS